MTPILLLTRKDEGHVFLSMEFESFCMDHTQGEVNHADGQVPKPSALDDLLGVSSTSMDVDPSSVNGVLCQRGDRIKCIHASAAGDQTVPCCDCHLFVSRETLSVSGL